MTPKTPKQITFAVVGGLLFAAFIVVTVHLMAATLAPVFERAAASKLKIPR